MQKKYLTLLALIVATSSLTACTPAQTPEATTEADKLSVVTTIFPAYDWTREVLGDNLTDVDLTMLLDTGVDLHSFQPTADDIITISDCDLFIYVGGESDGWVDDVLANRTNEDMVVINLLDVLGDAVQAEEIVEGMQESDHEHAECEDHDYDDEDHDHEECGNHHHEEVENDEHVWLSLRHAQTVTQAIADKLGEVDASNADIYTANADAYCDALATLDGKYATIVDNATFDTLLFGDRFPCRYLVDDYDLDYYAAFVGCSAETEASFETVKFLANKLDELDLPTVLTIEGTTHKIAQTIIDSTTAKNQTILTINSMQAVTADDVKNGETYLSIMTENKDVLQTALN